MVGLISDRISDLDRWVGVSGRAIATKHYSLWGGVGGVAL